MSLLERHTSEILDHESPEHLAEKAALGFELYVEGLLPVYAACFEIGDYDPGVARLQSQAHELYKRRLEIAGGQSVTPHHQLTVGCVTLYGAQCRTVHRLSGVIYKAHNWGSIENVPPKLRQTQGIYLA